MADVTSNPDDDITTYWFPVDPSQNDSSNNTYLDTIVDMQVGFSKSGAYGADWAIVSLPSSPSDGKHCIRVNTDDNNQMRLYSYNGIEGEWQFTVFRGAIGVTTVEEDITGTGPGTAIDYGGSAPRVNHTMQIVGRANAGSITEVEINFEGSLDGTEFFPIFSLFVQDLTTGINNVVNTIIMPLVKVRRNITLFTKSGDADVDVIIASV